MCGIAGIFSYEANVNDDINAITTALSHRGPDAQGIFVNQSQTVGLGHTRLSIIDLHETANQPLYSADKRYVIVFNGEIYNYKQLRQELIIHHHINFKTTSDTEVILEGFCVWNDKLVEKLQGMFAIAIFDQLAHKLYLIRDRVGKKPLYFFKSENLFVFASEIKSILKHRKVTESLNINRQAVSSFLHLGYIPAPLTIYSDVFKFPAGSIASLGIDLNLQVRPYWRVQDHIKPLKITSVEEAKTKLSFALKSAVHDRLVSDVPLGGFLSGGTDSSLITAIASNLSPTPFQTFSIGFKDNKFDESRYAREVAMHLQTDHTEYILSENEGIEILEKYLHHFDEPFADTSAIPTMLVSQLARQKVKVVLTGDGGDELFQGYGAYLWANRLADPIMKIIKSPLRTVLQGSQIGRFERIARLLEPVHIGSLRSHVFSQEQYLFSQAEILTRLLKEKNMFHAFEYDESEIKDSFLSEGEKQALFDLQYYLRDDLLVKVDRASMYYALECRSPFLDHRVIELAYSLDQSLKVRGGKAKWILKELLAQHLPATLVNRQKWGFSVPLATWLRNDLYYLFDQYLNDDLIEQVGIVNPEYIHELLYKFRAGKDYLYNRLWVLIVLHKWMKENL